MRLINKVIIHCSATPPKMNIGAVEIRKWHMSPDKNDPSKPWRDIGYHYVIRRSGDVDHGRDENVAGSHCAGQNANSIGICLIGGVNDQGDAENNFTPEQFKTLANWLRAFKGDYPDIRIYGHNEFSSKACPSFDVQAWLRSEGICG